jgi:hypothetical protein
MCCFTFDRIGRGTPTYFFDFPINKRMVFIAWKRKKKEKKKIRYKTKLQVVFSPQVKNCLLGGLGLGTHQTKFKLTDVVLLVGGPQKSRYTNLSLKRAPRTTQFEILRPRSAVLISRLKNIVD